MFHRLRKYIIRLIDVIGVLLFLSAVFAGWKLYKGPVSLDFLNPYIIDALTPDNKSIKVELKTTKLMWGRGVRPIDIRAYKVKIIKNDDKVFANIPEISLDFSFKALFNGVIAPKGVELLHPYFNLVRSESGKISFDARAKTKESTIKNIKKEIDVKNLIYAIKDLYKISAVNYLENINIINAEVSFVDKKLSKSLYFPDVDFSLKKGFQDYELSSSVTLSLANRHLYTSLDANYDRRNQDISYKLNFSNIKPLDITDFVKETKFLSLMNLSLKGEVNGVIDISDIDEKNNCQLLGLNCSSYKQTSFLLNTGVGTFTLPKSLDENKYTIYGIKLSGRLSTGLDIVYINSSQIDFGGPFASLTGKLSGIKEVIRGNGVKNLKAEISSHVKRLPFNDLPSYWPSVIGLSAHGWVKKRLTDGVFETSDFDINFSFDENGNIKLDKLTGVSEMKDVNVNYMTGMPIINDVSGQAHFDNDNIIIDVKNGTSLGLVVKNAKLKLLDLNSKQPHADFYIKSQGKIKNALKVVDSKPLRYAELLGIKPEEIKGNAETNLYLKFPFKENLTTSEVNVEVASVLENVEIPNIYKKHNLKNASLNLLLDNKTMSVTGFGYVKQKKVSLTWNEFFKDDAQFKNSYKLSTTLDDETRKKLGLDFLPISSPYVTGDIKIELVYKERQDKNSYLGVTADMADTKIYIPVFEWKKQKGESASAITTAVVTNKKIDDVSNFRFFSKDLELQGKLDFYKNKEKLKRIRFNKFKIGRTDAKAYFTLDEKQGLTVDLSGEVFDLETIIDNFFDNSKSNNLSKKTKKTPVQFNVAVDKVWGSKKGYINNVGAKLYKNKTGLKKLQLVGNLPSGKDLKFNITPKEKGGYELFLESKDAGQTLKAFGLLENIKNGYMRIDADIDENNNWNGMLNIKDFRLLSAPVFARLLTVASLTGVLDILSGEGIAFDRLDLPFEYKNQRLNIKKAKATGNSLGITSKGFVDFSKENGKMVVEGVIAPAYLINSLLGKIPLIGNIFGGGDGGGLFAASYEIKGSRKKPEITVNPLTALAPGFLRSLFGSAVEDAKKQEEFNKVPKAINKPIKELEVEENNNKKRNPKLPKAINAPIKEKQAQ